MAEPIRSSPAHLRVQLTLSGGRRGASSTRDGGFVGQLRVGTQPFACEIFPEEPLTPGGHAVHSQVTFQDPASALRHFPAGVTFELWDGGRIGYGTVLAVLR